MNKVCPQCQRKISGNTSVCPWCHATLPAEDRKTWTDDRPYGMFALIFSIFPIVSLVLGGLALSRNAGKQRTMGKIGLTITVILHVIVIFFLILVLNMYLENLKIDKIFN